MRRKETKKGDPFIFGRTAFRKEKGKKGKLQKGTDPNFYSDTGRGTDSLS